MMSRMNLNIIGEIDINKEFEKIFDDKFGFLVSNVVGPNHYFEMSGESMYFAIKAYEKECGVNLRNKKKMIVDALIRRKAWGKGVFLHAGFNGDYDTQLRSTSAAIRTLIEAKKDGFLVDDDLAEIIDFHYSYFFNWKNGVWFCHDTSEINGAVPKSHLKFKTHGKDKRNTLTLNTHLDSVSTLMLIMKNNISCNIDTYALLNKAITSINNLLMIDDKKSKLNFWLQNIDSLLFSNYLSALSLGREHVFHKIYAKILHPICFKFLSPSIFFKSGYIGRDMAVCNIHVDYLVVNITDFLRLLHVYHGLKGRMDRDLRVLNEASLMKIINNAVNLIESKVSLKQYILNSELQRAWYAELHFLFSFYNLKYDLIKNELVKSNMYNLHTTSFVNIYK